MNDALNDSLNDSPNDSPNDSMNDSMTGPLAVSNNPVKEFFLAPFRLRTYANLLYVWLSFPLGLFYFVGLMTGFSVGVGLLIVWIGVPVLLAAFLFTWIFGGFERVLASGLLGARIPDRTLPAVGEVGVWRWLGALLRNPALYKSILFLGLKFPVGLAGWVASVVGLALSTAFILSPVLYALGFGDLNDLEIGIWSPGSPTDLVLLAIVGVGVLWLTLNLLNVFGLLWKHLAQWLLGADDAPVPAAPVPPTGAEALAAA